MIYANPLTGDAKEGITQAESPYTIALADAAAFAAWWTAQGFPPPSSEPPTPALSEYAAAVQAHLDAAARSRDFDDIVSACSYAAGQNAFQADGLKFLTWRSQVWTFVYAMRDQAASSPGPMPTVEQFTALVFSNCPAPTF